MKWSRWDFIWSLALQFYLSINITSSLCISSLRFILIQRTFRSSYALIITSRYKTDSEQFLLSLFFCTKRIFGNVEYLRLFLDWHLRDVLLFGNLWLNSESPLFISRMIIVTHVLQCHLIKFRHLNKHLNNFPFEKFYVLPRWYTIYFRIVRDTLTGNIMQLSTAMSKISQN